MSRVLLVLCSLLLIVQNLGFTTSWTIPQDVGHFDDGDELQNSRDIGALAFNATWLSRRQTACGPVCGVGEVDPDTPVCRSIDSSRETCSISDQNRKRQEGLEDLKLAQAGEQPRHGYAGFRALRKRVIEPLTQQTLPNYVRDQLFGPGPTDPQYGEAIHRFAGTDGEDETDFRLERLPRLGPNGGASAPFQMGSAPIHGCTVVVIVSKRAVFMGHIWENSFSCSAYFENRCLAWISGQGTRNGQGDAFDPALFNQPNDDTRVFIAHPRNRRSFGIGNPFSPQYYQVRVPQLLATIRSALGNSNVPLVLFNYRAIDTDRTKNDPDLGQYQTSQRGCVLFQYDPNGRGQGRPGWRLLLEHHQFQDTDPPVGPEAARGIPD